MNPLPKSMAVLTLCALTALTATAQDGKGKAANQPNTNKKAAAQAGLLNGGKPRLRTVDDAQRITLRGNTHPLANVRNDAGRSRADLRMDKMILVLAPRPGTSADIQQLIREQHTPGSPNFHQWLTPEQFGQRFGITDEDLATVTQWLESKGFAVDEVAKGRGWINFSGNASQVEDAFQTQIHDFSVKGKLEHGNISDPTIPAALSDLVLGVKSLHSFKSKPMHTGAKPIAGNSTTPDFNSGTSHFLAPGDFATIYNVKPLYSAGIDGTGQSIAIVGRTDIKTADVAFFRSNFGLPAKAPVIIHNGTAPGDLGGGEETEADLDVEWSGAVGKGATVNFVVSKSTTTTDGVDLSAQYIVNNNVAPVMSTSFGQCESSMGTTENNFYNNLWSQAATEGITSFVSSGDSGAAGCDSSSATTSTGGRAVSGLSSTPNNVAVGGTQFNDTASPSSFWSSTQASDGSSALGYIPEIVWNESTGHTGGSGLFSTGGGASIIYGKPSFQSAPGVPADGKRDVPDVSLTAAGHDGYIIVQGHTATASGLAAVGGTSAASPSFAGLLSLVNQKTAARQGNANTTFYTLGRNQYASGGAAVYHDTTSGNNTVPGTTGFSATAGYDQSTGLGSVDANAMVNNWTGSGTPPPPPPPPGSQLIGNPGFENGSASPAPWTTTAGVIDNSTGEAAHAGSWKAWMDGYGTTHTDTVRQTVTIPSTVTTATLTFWLHIDTAETTTTTQFDKLTVQVRNSAGTVLSTLATYSNLNKATGYSQKSFNLASFKGQTVQIFFTASEDSSLQTSFVVDDVNLNVQ